jgi:uncharacterized protein YjbI with pentapeptide repeats
MTEASDSAELVRKAISEKADDYDNVRSAVDEASSSVRALWITFISLGAYLVIAAASVTHLQLFLETPIKLPLLDVSLPLVAFFWVAPLVFIVFHFYLLLQLFVLAKKLRRFNEVLADLKLADGVRQKLRQLLPNDLLVQFLAGPRDQREGTIGLMFRVIAWITIVFGPLLLLLLIQFKFLPYQDESVTWVNRIEVLLDLVVLWMLWPAIAYHTQAQPTGTAETKSILENMMQFRFLTIAGAAVMVVACSLIALTFPGEWLDGFWPQQLFHRIFAWQIPEDRLSPKRKTELHSQIWPIRAIATLMPRYDLRDLDMTDWLESVPEARRLIPGSLRLSGAEIVDEVKLKRIEERSKELNLHAWEGERTGTFINRRFVAADFSGADLQRTDLGDSIFDRANFIGAKLNGALLKRTRFNNALLNGAQLSEALLDSSELKSASLGNAKLKQASLYRAYLQEASLIGASLQGAVLGYSHLQGASLLAAHLEGASLVHAELQGAELDDSQLQATRFDQAQLEGASLVNANLQGASLVGAQLQGATLERAQLQGAALDQAQLEGVSLDDAEMRDASFVGTNLYRATRNGAVSEMRFEYNSTTASYEPGRVSPIDDKIVALWIMTATEYVRDDRRKSPIIKRLSRLNPNSVQAAQDREIASYWAGVKTLPLDRYQSILERSLITLACEANASPLVARALLHGAFLESSARAAATGPYFYAFDQILRAGRNDTDTCPGVKDFVENDWGVLGRLADAAPKPSDTVILESICSSKTGPLVARGFMRDGIGLFKVDYISGIASKLRSALSHPETCPGVKGLTESDWKTLAALSPEPARSLTPRKANTVPSNSP